MKKNWLIAILFVSFGLATQAQKSTNVSIDSSSAKVVYRSALEQTVNVIINYNKVDKDENIYQGEVKVEEIGSTTTYYNKNSFPLKFIFGPGYQTSVKVPIKLLADTTIKTPYLLKFIITIEGFKEPLEHFLYYLPRDVVKTVEGTFIKTADELKADIHSLRSQLFNGDTSTTYIGQIELKKFARVITSNSPLKSKSLHDVIKDIQTKNMESEFLKGKKIDIGQTVEGSKTTSPGYSVTNKAIDSVVMKISEGVIEFIEVKMIDSSKFINLYAPIPLFSLDKRYKEKLINPDDGSFIFVHDAFNFKATQRFNYFPSDKTVVLTNNPAKPKYRDKLFANNGLNSFVDLRIFTDLLGALDNQPNGLLQVEAKSKIYLHRNNSFRDFIYLFHALEPQVGISKLDSKYDTVKLNNVNKTLNRMDLFQRSFLKIGLKLNMFRWDFRPSNSLLLNSGYQFNAGNISIRDAANQTDSVVAKGVFHMPYFEIAILSKRVNGFGFEGGARYMFQRINKNKHFTNSGYQHLMDFGLTAFYFVGKQPKDKFFVRFVNTLNFKEREEDFYQFQFGYSLSLKI